MRKVYARERGGVGDWRREDEKTRRREDEKTDEGRR
jgi:hypothetical protein